LNLTEKAINQPILVLLLGLFIFIMGIAAYITLPLEAVPEIEVPVAMVVTPYRGAAPTEIEAEIIKPMEDKLSELKELKIVRMYALQGMAFCWVQFLPDSDTEKSLDDLREKISEAEKEFPEEADSPVISEMDFSELPILILNLFGDYDTFELTRFAERLESELERSPGINDVNIFGSIEREIKVLVDPDKLESMNFSIIQILSIIQQNNINMPGGNITLDGEDLLIRTKGKFDHLDQLENIIVFASPSGGVTRLRDIARIVDQYEEAKTYSRYNQQNSITLLISKRYGNNILDVTYNIENKVKELMSDFPLGLNYEYSARQATDIERQNSQLNQNAMLGGLLVILTLFFGIGFRNSLIVAIAIPFSIFTAFLLMSITGLSQTGIAMFAMIMVLGIVVDGAIIVAESTYRRMENGLDRVEASKQAIYQVGGPILTALLTSMAAFAPLIYMSGIMGQFLSVIPKVVIFALIGAAIADHILIPVLTSKLMILSKNTGHLSGNWFGMKVYTKMINWAMKHRIQTMLMAAISFILGLMIVGISIFSDTKLIKIQAFPRVPKPRIIVDISTPPGSDLDFTDSITRNIEEVISGYLEVETFVTTVGETGIQNIRLSQGGSTGNEVSQINVDLVHKKDRDRSVEEIVEDLNNQFMNRWPGVNIQIDMIREGPPVSDNLVLDLQGNNLDDLEMVSEQIKSKMKNISGTRNVSTSLGQTRNEIQINVDYDRASFLGVSASSITSTIAGAMYGIEATQFTDGLEEIPVIIKLDIINTEVIQKLKRLKIISVNGSPVLLNDVANIKIAPGQSFIYRKEFERTVSVSTDMDEDTDASDIKRKLNAEIKDMIVPEGVKMEYGGIDDDTQESFQSLAESMGIAFLIILVLLSAQFKSLMQPLIIAITIPLAFVGVIFGLMITRVAFGLMAFFGLVALTGVVVNDAIVLISHINDLRREGTPYWEAIVEGGKHRLRPIILTTVTTISGMIPLTLDFVGGAEYWRPLAVSIIFGLGMATLLTLIVVPVLYSLIVRDKQLI
jgi:multidrug efflux pump subunit AcrB